MNPETVCASNWSIFMLILCIYVKKAFLSIHSKIIELIVSFVSR